MAIHGRACATVAPYMAASRGGKRPRLCIRSLPPLVMTTSPKTSASCFANDCRIVSRCMGEVLSETARFMVRRFGSTAERQMPRRSSNDDQAHKAVSKTVGSGWNDRWGR